MKLNFNINFESGLFTKPKKMVLAAKKDPEQGKVLNYVKSSVRVTEKSIQDYQLALNLAKAEEPKYFLLQNIIEDILNDSLVTAQLENRRNQIYSADFNLKNAQGETDIEQTNVLKNSGLFRKISAEVNNAQFFKYSLIELQKVNDINGERVEVSVLPRTNVCPDLGRFYPDYTNDSTYIEYRKLNEYGTTILEFNTDALGLLSKVVAHVIFKKFAQSCWSELCEIYGIPPRVLKTNTTDPKQLAQAEEMMTAMGSAAWYIIDKTEEFDFAQGVNTNGDVYQNLITLCNNEISLAISGAVIGQDTKFGSNNKDESAQEMLWLLVQSDMQLIEQEWNTTIIPALVRIGVLKPGLRFEFEPAEDVEQLFKFATGLLPFKDLDDEWLEQKFGVKISGDKDSDGDDQPQPDTKKKKKQEQKLGFQLSGGNNLIPPNFFD